MKLCYGSRGHTHEEIAFNNNAWDCPFCETLDELDQALTAADTLRGQLEERGLTPKA